ncbi:hypothetical protein CDAR_14271 [Caerostris darwini]|uniref:Uncharacterized protein n=1 Tax=Caerostris darwini TaxID=1538125 RepID=A0AAV4QD15_9ARAC|nr:hypothetical protein CDAR_14271 [Caerostris darwini]
MLILIWIPRQHTWYEVLDGTWFIWYPDVDLDLDTQITYLVRDSDFLVEPKAPICTPGLGTRNLTVSEKIGFRAGGPVEEDSGITFRSGCPESGCEFREIPGKLNFFLYDAT